MLDYSSLFYIMTTQFVVNNKKDETEFLGEFLEEVVEVDEEMFLEHNQASYDTQFEDESALQHKYRLKLFDYKVAHSGTGSGIDVYVVKNSDFSSHRVYQKKLSYTSINYNNACCNKKASTWRRLVDNGGDLMISIVVFRSWYFLRKT